MEPVCLARRALAVALAAGGAACVEVSAQPEPRTILECAADAGVEAQPPEPCDDSDIIVLLDRSGSMVDHPFAPRPNAELGDAVWMFGLGGGSDSRRLATRPTNFDIAHRIVQRVVDEAAKSSPFASSINVEVIGFPSPTARGCTASEPASPTQALGSWRRPRAGRDATPLEPALGQVARVIATRGSSRRVRLLLITDGKQDCGGRKVAYDSGEMRELLNSQLSSVASRVAGAEVILFDRPESEGDAAQRAFDAVFEGRCRVTPAPAPPPPARMSGPQPFPDVVAVGRDGAWPCSGVLIGSSSGGEHARGRLVLTARHCLPATEVALVGTSTAAAPTIAVRAMIPHPDPAIDASLLVLDRPAVRPTHPMRAATDDAAPAGVVRVVGFGADDARGTHGAGDLHVVDLPMSGWGCDPRSAEALGCLPGFELVARGNGGHDACRGDSGAPAFERTPCGWRLLGIVSRSVPDARRACGDGGIYTRVDAIAPWIAATVSLLGDDSP